MFQDVLRVGLVLFGLTATLHAEDRTALQIASPTVTLLYSFGGGTSDGKWPSSPLVMQSGILYGTTPAGGNAVWGTVFSLTPPASAGGAWTEQILHNFANGSDGGSP